MRHHAYRDLILCATLLSALAWTAAAPAQADEKPDAGDTGVSATAHARRAQVAYDLQEWDTAAGHYQAAYRADQKPRYLWGLAQTHRMSGNYPDAIKTYRAYQRASKVSASQSNAAEMMITKCEAEVAKAEARAAKAAQQHSEKEAAPPPLPQPAPKRDQPESSGGLGVGWFVTGVSITAVLGAATVWSGLDTQSKNTTYEENPTRDRYLEGKDLEKRTNILIGATAIGAVSTTVLALFTDWSSGADERNERGLRVQPAVAHRGGAVLLSGDF